LLPCRSLSGDDETTIRAAGGNAATPATGAKDRFRMRNRGLFLLATVVLAVGLVACGRATEEQISQALGITPTPTRSPEEIASATAAVAATEAARATVAAAPEAAAVRGDASRGQRQFMTWCTGCHRPGGAGPDILAPGGPGSDVTPDSLLALLREGTGHPEGVTYSTTEITDSQVDDIAAYILSRAGQ